MTKIVIFGFKSAGKTTFGKALAKALNIPFFDSDELLLKQLKTTHSIRELFHDIGENSFRQKEFTLLRAFIPSLHGILSLGGGTLDEPLNQQLIKDIPLRIYLYAPFEVIVERLKQEPSYVFQKTLQEKYLEREKIFKKMSHLTIPIPILNFSETLTTIEAFLYG